MLVLTRRRSVAASAAFLGLLVAARAFARPAQLVDTLGREVTVDLPAKRVVLGFYLEDYMAIGGPGGFDRVVGISKAVWRDWTPESWAAYVGRDPALDDLPDIGDVENGSFSTEAVIELKPDVLILAEYQYRMVPEAVDTLVRAGVPVVVADFHTHRLANALATIRLLGRIAGSEARAEEIAQTYESTLVDVRRRIAAAGRPRPAVYLEFGNGGPAVPGISWGSYMWGAMTETAGGDNIARDLVETWAPINPEEVLHRRPDVIVITGSEWKDRPGALRIGHGVPAEDVRHVLRSYSERPGWRDLPAVQNGRLFALYQGASRTLPDYIAVQYLAKAFYPELFADLDPADAYRRYYERYLPIVPDGTFMIGLGATD